MLAEEIAVAWRGIVDHPGPWRRCATQISQPGLSGGLEVECRTIRPIPLNLV